MKWYPLAHLAAVTMSMFLRRMYLRTIGHRFMQMMAYFLVMNSKRCKVAHGLACLLIKLRNDSTVFLKWLVFILQILQCNLDFGLASYCYLELVKLT